MKPTPVDPRDLPEWAIWEQRPFPDANLLLITGRRPALVDSGFVGHASDTAAWARARAGRVDLVVNTHWHSDHVGGNALLQQMGAGVAASTPDAEALQRRDPGCCLVEYLDQPVAPYSVDQAIRHGQALQLGDLDWQVIATPGHTPGHLAFWQPEERLLMVGDALSTYDVGWVNLALDGQEAAVAGLTSLRRLADLRPRVLLPSHGPVPEDPAAAFTEALRRAQRLVDDPPGAVWYGARRIFAFALMIRGGIPAADVEDYLHARAWLTDAARLLGMHPHAMATELVETMVRGGAVIYDDGILRAAADHTPVGRESLRQPFPRDWPPPTANRTATSRSVKSTLAERAVSARSAGQL